MDPSLELRAFLRSMATLQRFCKQETHSPPPDPMLPIAKIASGGQTGADRAGLDFAIEHGIPHGGWCPKGRLAEDGPIDARYDLKETPSSNYLQRTEWNARDADGTVVFSIGPTLSGGSKKTVSLAHKHGKPHGCAA